MGQDGRRRPLVPGAAAWIELYCRRRFWTGPELALLREHYPNREKLAELLPHRTFGACSLQWNRRWPTGSVRPWTGTEIKTLRDLYPVATWEEVKKAFPHRTGGAIRTQACKRQLYRPTYPFRPSGNPIVDTVKLQARKEGLSMRFLDLEAGSGQYFRSSSRHGFVRTGAIKNALRVLGGQLQIAWDGEIAVNLFPPSPVAENAAERIESAP